MRRWREEIIAVTQMQNSRVKEEGASEASPEVKQRLLRLEDELRNQQRAYDRLGGDSVEDERAIKGYLDQVHEMVTSLLQRRQEPQPSMPEVVRPQMTRLTSAAQRGDMKVEVQSPDFCCVGEIVLIGGQEAKTVISKGSLVFRVSLERDYPEGTTVRPMRDDDFLQIEGENMCTYRCDRVRTCAHIAVIWKETFILCAMLTLCKGRSLSGQMIKTSSKIKSILTILINGSNMQWKLVWLLTDQSPEEEDQCYHLCLRHKSGRGS